MSMRKDMKDVINEPAKGGSRYDYSKSPFKRVDMEDQPLVESMHLQTRGTERGSRINTNPFRRWLHKQVGRPWNDVYSEASKILKQHPLKGWNSSIDRLISWFVDVDVEMINGIPHSTGYSGLLPITKHRNSATALYVHPDTFLLTDCKPVKEKREPEPETFRQLKRLKTAPKGHKASIFDTNIIQYWYEAFEKIEGIWYFTIGYKKLAMDFTMISTENGHVIN